MDTPIMKQLEDLGIREIHLDEAVHNAASDMASNANNGGVSEQVEFLKTQAGWSDEEILKAAKKGIEEN